MLLEKGLKYNLTQ